MAKVIGGESSLFSNMSIVEVGSNMVFKIYSADQVRFFTPEILDYLDDDESNDLVDGLGDIFEGQIWWDLGVILYELSTGGNHPFYNKNQNV